MSSSLRQRAPGAAAAAEEPLQPSQADAPPPRRAPQPPPQQPRAPPFQGARLVSMLLAAAIATAMLAARQPQVQQQLGSLQQRVLSRLPLSVARLARRQRVFSQQELAAHAAGSPGGTLYVAVLGEVFDVSDKPEFYGPGGGYAHFAGTDGSLSFITGDFERDVTDDVSSLDAQSCLGLVGWLDFYHETYPCLGKRVGAFYDERGQPTPALASVHTRAAEGKKLQAEQEDETVKWPNCNSKWTEAAGGRVWCDGGRYPRKLYVTMVNGKPSWRCACFEEMGWSDLRQVYPECEPDAHDCSTDAMSEEASREADDAATRLMQEIGNMQ